MNRLRATQEALRDTGTLPGAAAATVLIATAVVYWVAGTVVPLAIAVFAIGVLAWAFRAHR